MAPVVSVEVGPPAKKGEGRARRYYKSADALVQAPEKIRCLSDIINNAAEQYPNDQAMGWRDTIDMITEEKDVKKTVGGKEVTEKKTWSYWHLSEYKWWTYAELAEYIKYAGQALVHTGHSKDTIFNIYSGTSRRWQVMANACASQSITFATAYDSLGEEGLAHSINQPEVYGVFTNANLLDTIAKVVSQTPSLKVVIYDGEDKDVKKGAIEALEKAGLKVHKFDDFIELGKQSPWLVQLNDPNPGKGDDIACIMYTSGSTGAPKGVQITHTNIIACIGAVEVLLPHIIKHGETYIGYLPLAHIMELAVELSLLAVGARVGYATVKTLTDASVRNCAGDIRTLQPTIMVGVPAVWELIRKGIVSKVKSSGMIKSNLFWAAVALKKAAGIGSLLGSIADAVVFKAVAAGLGGKLKYAMSGGAPISKETQEFLSIALVLMIQGYGMTESTAMAALLPPELHRYGTVGVPVPSVEIKLVDVEETGYSAMNDPPQGEICIRGPSITKGYYKNEEETKQTIDEDGWMHTGDIGQWNKDGTLSLIDRKKNLVKLSGGEYIALERLESIYKSSQYVSNIVVYGDSNASRPMAIVYGHEANLKGLVKQQGIDVEDDFAAIAHNDQVKKAVLNDLVAVGKKAGLKQLELLSTIVLDSTEWTAQNGLLTAAQKLQRKPIVEHYKKEIDAVYP
ncbi:BQ2448_2672 [Microbotryum intermedium]|uniref:BQ2448_2672 protein n=1 Tax=Microbotryum intermedium TaxID=269621 RepID=A0A238FGR8_9BASI|nr:BQ2448_2672 [Microbotryum intermedium]